VPGRRVVLLGKSGAGYVVGVTDAQGDNGVVKRVRPGAARVRLRGVSPFDLLLSDDGQHLVRTVNRTAARTRVTVYDAEGGGWSSDPGVPTAPSRGTSSATP
jgi:hypothetical protein